jgi:hypothetical protein
MLLARVGTLFQTAAVLLALSTAALAQVQYDDASQFPSTNPNYHSERGGYTFKIPTGWLRIPKKELTAMTEQIMSKQSPTANICDVAFQSTGGGQWFTYPYVLVQIIPYGTYRQPNEKEMEAAVRSITGVNPKQALEKALTQEARNLVDSAKIDAPQLDAANHAFTMTTQMNVAGIGKVKGEMHGYFGKQAVVQVAFFDRADRWAFNTADRAAVAKAFTFDADQAYDPKLNEAGGRAMMRIGAVVSALAGAFAVVKIKQAMSRREA